MLPFVMLPRPLQDNVVGKGGTPASSAKRSIPTRSIPPATTWI